MSRSLTNRPAAASAAGLAAAALVLLTILLGGVMVPGYDPSAQYLSELGAEGAPHALLVNFGVFLPVGVLVAAFVLFGWQQLAVSRGGAAGAVLLLGVSAGYLLAVIAPCDAGCPASGSLRQAVHNVGGLLEYLGGGFGLLLIGRALLRRPGSQGTAMSAVFAATAVLGVFFLALGPQPESPIRGLWQRVAEFALFGWIALAAWRMRPGQSPEPSSE